MITKADFPRIVFGCGSIGGLGSSPALRDKGIDRAQGLALLDYMRDLGLVRFDTANTYGGGASETVLGEWLRAQPSSYRAGIQVATKVGNPHGAPPGERPLSRAQVADHLDRSLQRLGLERIDLYYLHEFDPSTPLAETLEALDRALTQGKIASFGVSNATLKNFTEMLSLSGAGALRRAFTHLQNEFNLLQQRDLADIIPLAEQEGISYVAFSPLAGGILSGKYREGQAPEPGTRVDSAPEMYGRMLTKGTFAAIDGLRQRAAERGWTVPGAALRFILDTPGLGGLIVAPRSIEQFEGYGIG